MFTCVNLSMRVYVCGYPCVCLPVSCCEGSQFELPWLRFSGIIEDLLELGLQLTGPEVTPPVVQPHFEEAALVVHHQMLPVAQMLDKV